MLASCLLVGTTLLLAVPAVAQQPPADPNTQALGQMVIEGVQREAQVRAQLIAAQARIATLEAAAKPPTPHDPPARMEPVPNATLPSPETPKP